MVTIILCAGHHIFDNHRIISILLKLLEPNELVMPSYWMTADIFHLESSVELALLLLCIYLVEDGVLSWQQNFSIKTMSLYRWREFFKFRLSRVATNPVVCTTINSCKTNIRFLCQAPTKKEQILKENSATKDTNTQEQKYPGYEIIYRCPYVRYIAVYNRIKRLTVIQGLIMPPVAVMLSQMSIISEDFSVISSAFALAFMLAIYIPGIFLNNQIGIIYYKDNESIKIAYVDMWGKRVDIDTSVEDIKSLTISSPLITDKLYRTIHITSLKYPLKLFVKNGVIPDKERLANILGDYE
ncbi:hypothetical protein KPH14_001546 [Odynerus spinipes]|uniref:Transmembrane protein 186 n=1 Tax=Odynerus spinipes TaxID=1348599 RepID=A0AAD9RW29_9HYME|nr:hypothetical protein KPH14_001546 [Odynerus spinipes]